MSCYFRHMKDALEEAGVEVTKDNKKTIDQAIHNLVNVEYKNCSPTWKAVKAQIQGDEKAKKRFIKKLRETLAVSH
jgi:predicted Fe-Mo cluster-binding NifX family protein